MRVRSGSARTLLLVQAERARRLGQLRLYYHFSSISMGLVHSAAYASLTPNRERGIIKARERAIMRTRSGGIKCVCSHLGHHSSGFESLKIVD